MIQAVVPTIPGREHHLKACIDSLEQHNIEPVVILDSPSCGEGWEFGLERCDAKYVALWSDDFTINHWDWGRIRRRLEQTITVLSPLILNPDGTRQGSGGFGLNLDDGAQAVNCICPIGERHVLEWFRPWPHLNHYCDTWISQRAIWADRGPTVTWDAVLVHHHLSGWDPAEYVAWQKWLGRP